MNTMYANEAMAERPSYRFENRELLINAMMNQLGITEEDLERDTSWIRAKIREANIEKVLEKK